MRSTHRAWKLAGLLTCTCPPYQTGWRHVEYLGPRDTPTCSFCHKRVVADAVDFIDEVLAHVERP